MQRFLVPHQRDCEVFHSLGNKIINDRPLNPRQVAENAVHAAMAGKTGIVIGHWNNYFTHVPVTLATKERLRIDLDGALWKGVLSATRQNDYFGI
jgi:hypothetical protein